jgi:hypothetical protein
LYSFTGEHVYISQIISLGQILVYFNSGTNPLIYNAVNEQFREGFRQYFQSWRDLLLKLKGKQNRKRRNQNSRTKTKCSMRTVIEEETLDRTISSPSDNDNNNCNAQARCLNTVITTDDAESDLLSTQI